jgi:hypothetical protein
MTESHWERVERLKTLFFEQLETEKDDIPGSALTKVKHGMDQWIAFEKRVERVRGVRQDGEVTMLFTFLLMPFDEQYALVASCLNERLDDLEAMMDRQKQKTIQ